MVISSNENKKEETEGKVTKVVYAIDGKEVSITIPEGEVTYLGDNLDTKLYSISDYGVISIKDKSLLAENKSIIIPSKLDNQEVTAIVADCFKDTDIESISIPSSVTSIGASAFSGCSKLTDIVIPCNLTLSADSFADCDNISKITIIASGNSTEIVDNDNMPWHKTKVGVEIEISEGIEKVGQAAFADGGVDGLNHITKVTIPSSVKELGMWAFSGCDSLEDITIEEGLETINGAAFLWCKKLTEIVLPSSVKTLSDNVFNNCEGMKNIYFKGSSTGITLDVNWKGNCTALDTYNYNG